MKHVVSCNFFYQHSIIFLKIANVPKNGDGQLHQKYHVTKIISMTSRTEKIEIFIQNANLVEVHLVPNIQRGLGLDLGPEAETRTNLKININIGMKIFLKGG